MSTENEPVATCPQCGSVFRLTAQHLQAAKGWVQCGMCGHVFHSGIKPAADDPVSESKASPAPPSAAEPPAEIIFAGPVAEAPPEPAAEDAASRALSGLAQRMTERDMPSGFGPKLESIILVDPNLPVDDDYGPLPVIEPHAETARADASSPASPISGPAAPPPGGWGARQASATSTGWIPRRPPTVERPVKKSSPLAWLWALLVILLLLALAAQLAYFLRDRIASSYPEFRPQLAQLCEALDCTLSLPRDTKQVLILGSDLQTEDGGRLKLEITLANRASHAMAWPVLELTLTDVEDQPLARRMFAPSEYLPSGKMETVGIKARSEIPFNLQLQSKGIKAAGYRLRMFY